MFAAVYVYREGVMKNLIKQLNYKDLIRFLISASLLTYITTREYTNIQPDNVKLVAALEMFERR